ncbi:MAG: 6-hydroxycyclohex-1-ene-1-carbonyl-CoA dehydrogenase [bacterium]|nr:6-hydroxycyclohex-1-ene-1-carbonyl-CoA dehydrogenase [bacterium]
MSMISWQMVKPGLPLQRVEGPIPEPGPGEVRIRVAGCGVCHTDLGFYYDGVRTRSPLPLTLGHEISGMVEAAGPGAEPWQGKAVIVPAVMPCGECDVCGRGLGNICRKQKMPGNDVDGGFATHTVVPCRGLCEVPVSAPDAPAGDSGVTLVELSVIADAVTTPYQAIVDAGLTEDDTAIFVGVGGVGGFGAQIAKALGAAAVAVDVDSARLEALEPYVDLTLNAGEGSAKDLRKRVGALAKEQGRRATEWKIFETSGTGAGQETAFGMMTFGASLGVVGFTMEAPALRLSNLMAFHASARGSWGCIPEHYPAALELVTSGKVKVGPFAERFPLDEIGEVFEQVHQHKIRRRPVMVP